jgi:hypothetical protein
VLIFLPHLFSTFRPLILCVVFAAPSEVFSTFRPLIPCVVFAAPSEVFMEGWLAVPNKQNIKKYGWKKQYVVVSSKKVLFYNTEGDRQNVSDPVIVIDIE